VVIIFTNAIPCHELQRHGGGGGGLISHNFEKTFDTIICFFFGNFDYNSKHFFMNAAWEGATAPRPTLEPPLECIGFNIKYFSFFTNILLKKFVMGGGGYLIFLLEAKNT